MNDDNNNQHIDYNDDEAEDEDWSDTELVDPTVVPIDDTSYKIIKPVSSQSTILQEILIYEQNENNALNKYHNRQFRKEEHIATEEQSSVYYNYTLCKILVTSDMIINKQVIINILLEYTIPNKEFIILYPIFINYDISNEEIYFKKYLKQKKNYLLTLLQDRSFYYGNLRKRGSLKIEKTQRFVRGEIEFYYIIGHDEISIEIVELNDLINCVDRLLYCE